MSSILGIGLSALRVAQRAVENAAHNVANANTDGYTRQRVVITQARPVPGAAGARGEGMRGTGAQIVGIDRLRNALADLSYRGETAAHGAWAGRADVLRSAEQILGPYGEGAPAALSAFFAAWQEVSTNPTDPAARQGVLDSGGAAAHALNVAAGGLDRLAQDTGSRIAEGVDEVNRLTAHVAQLNTAISDAITTQQAPNDLLDERDRALDRLVHLTGATVADGEVGRVNVFLGGQAIVRGEGSSPLAVHHTGTVTNVVNASGDPVAIGGQVGGYVDTLANTLPSLHADLDAVATGLMNAVNTVHRNGFDQDGNPGVDFFTGTGARDIAVASGLGTRGVAASATGPAADGNNALALAQLRTAPAVGTASVVDAVNAFAGRLGAESAGATQSERAAELVVASADRQRAESNGVSVDEEMVDLVRYQRAYEAAARVVNVADSLLDRVINGMGVGS